MSIITPKDEEYWLAKEEAIIPLLVDLAEYGFLTDHDCHRQGWTDNPRVLVRLTDTDGSRLRVFILWGVYLVLMQVALLPLQ